MIPLDWILDHAFMIPEGFCFAQIPGSGWMGVPHDWFPLEQADCWVLFYAAETYRQAQREERGY